MCPDCSYVDESLLTFPSRDNAENVSMITVSLFYLKNGLIFYVWKFFCDADMNDSTQNCKNIRTDWNMTSKTQKYKNNNCQSDVDHAS